MCDLHSRPLLDLTSQEVADAVNAGFEGYIVPVHFTPEQLERRLRPEHLDAEASRVYWQEGALAGAVLVARRGRMSRVAAMGVAAPLRGQGLGRAMLEGVLAAARARGDRAVTLEAIEENLPAIRLYASCGFVVTRRLVGCERDPEQGEAAPLREVDAADLARLVAQDGETGLPWMLDPATLAAQVAPVRAWTVDGRSMLLAAEPVGGAMTLLALVTRREARGQGQARRLLRAVVHHFEGCGVRVIPVVPEGLGQAFLERVGFRPMSLSQVEMRVELG